MLRIHRGTALTVDEPSEDLVTTRIPSRSHKFAELRETAVTAIGAINRTVDNLESFLIDGSRQFGPTETASGPLNTMIVKLHAVSRT